MHLTRVARSRCSCAHACYLHDAARDSHRRRVGYGPPFGPKGCGTRRHTRRLAVCVGYGLSLPYDSFLCEWEDKQRMGGYEALRYLPKSGASVVVLGIVSSKVGQVETKDYLLKELEQATQYADRAASRCRRSVASPRRSRATW
jgi:hypothetical protein